MYQLISMYCKVFSNELDKHKSLFIKIMKLGGLFYIKIVCCFVKRISTEFT